MKAGAKRSADLEDLHGTLKRLLGEHETLFEGTWQRLTLAQRAALRAAVLEDGHELLSGDVRARHRLSGTSTVQASLAALVREDILTRDGTGYAVGGFAVSGVGEHGQRRSRPRIRSLT